MTIDEAIKIIERWQAGGFATRIEDMNPAIKLGIEALKRLQEQRSRTVIDEDDLLPGETKDEVTSQDIKHRLGWALG